MTRPSKRQKRHLKPYLRFTFVSKFYQKIYIPWFCKIQWLKTEKKNLGVGRFSDHGTDPLPLENPWRRRWHQVLPVLGLGVRIRCEKHRISNQLLLCDVSGTMIGIHVSDSEIRSTCRPDSARRPGVNFSIDVRSVEQGRL